MEKMDFVLELQRLMIKNNYLIAIRDNFENLLSKSVLKITDDKIRGESVDVHIKNRVFSVIVECVQNICVTEGGEQKEKDSVLLMNRLEDGYQIVAGSRINEERKSRVENLLTQLREASNELIKEMRKEILKSREEVDEEIQEKLTFIELFLRSDRNVKSYFNQEGDNSYFLMLEIEIRS